MRRALVVLVLLALPASASAAPFGELPFRPVSGAATCLRATGAPAELVRWVRDGAEVLTARPEGLVPQATVPLGDLQGCPSMASEAGGAAVIAGPLRTGVRVAVREPGGGWGAPITFPARNIGAVDVAVSARGDAVVAWEQDVTLTEGRARVVRRSAGGAFGAPEQVASVPADISVGMAADGATTVMLVGERDVRVTSAPLGSAFGATRRLLRRWFGADFPELAVAADGRVLVAAPDDDGLVLFERPPGGELERVSAIPDVRASELALALRPGGAAAIGWKGGLQVGAIVRDGPGAFGPPVVVAEDEPVNGEQRHYAAHHLRTAVRAGGRVAVGARRRRARAARLGLRGRRRADRHGHLVRRLRAALARRARSATDGDHAARTRRRRPCPRVDGQQPHLLGAAVRGAAASRARGRRGDAGRSRAARHGRCAARSHAASGAVAAAADPLQRGL